MNNYYKTPKNLEFCFFNFLMLLFLWIASIFGTVFLIFPCYLFLIFINKVFCYKVISFLTKVWFDSSYVNIISIFKMFFRLFAVFVF